MCVCVCVCIGALFCSICAFGESATMLFSTRGVLWSLVCAFVVLSVVFLRAPGVLNVRLGAFEMFIVITEQILIRKECKMAHYKHTCGYIVQN